MLHLTLVTFVPSVDILRYRHIDTSHPHLVIELHTILADFVTHSPASHHLNPAHSIFSSFAYYPAAAASQVITHRDTHSTST